MNSRSATTLGNTLVLHLTLPPESYLKIFLKLYSVYEWCLWMALKVFFRTEYTLNRSLRLTVNQVKMHFSKIDQTNLLVWKIDQLQCIRIAVNWILKRIVSLDRFLKHDLPLDRFSSIFLERPEVLEYFLWRYRDALFQLWLLFKPFSERRWA